MLATAGEQSVVNVSTDKPAPGGYGRTTMDGLRLSLQALAVRLTQDGSSRLPREATAAAPTQAALSRSDLVTSSPDLAELLAIPLDRLMREGQLLEIRVAWHAETFWFVPDECDATVLGREGVGRGRVWTARELMVVMALPGRTPAVVWSIALTKVTIDGDLVEVQRGPIREDDQKVLRDDRADGACPPPSSGATALSTP